MDIQALTVKQILTGYETGDFSAEEVVKAYISRINKKNNEINAVLWISDTALDEARAIDSARKEGKELGRLAGVPILLKDNILVEGWENTAGSQILEGYTSAYSATVVKRLREAGAILLGRVNLDEFAMGSTTESSHFGETKNPWNTEKVPGGSSGGSAAAVAAGFAPVALGSDTGGSVRQPAAMCGVVGLKPTYGRVSRYGLIAYASSFDQIGPIARTVEDAALVLEVIEGRDPQDATSEELTSTTIPDLLEDDLSGFKVGVPKEYFVEGMDAEIKEQVMQGIEELKTAGAEVVEVSLPHVEHALAAYYILVLSEASSNLGRFDGLRYGYHSDGQDLVQTYANTRGEGFGAEVKRRILLGTYTLSAGYYDAYYRKALKLRTLIKQDFDKVFEEVDVLVTPTSPSVAWNLGEHFEDPLTMYLADIFTITANLATIPGMSVPCGFVDGLPVGMQVLAKPFNEHAMLKVGAAYQHRTDWHTYLRRNE